MRKLKKDKNDIDPLAGLTQIDNDIDLREQEALTLLVRMLDNVEDFDALSDDLRTLISEDVVLESKITHLFDVLIKGLKQEQTFLASIGVLP